MLLVLVLVLAAASVASAQEALPTALTPQQEQTALRRAEQEGRLIYRHDRAGWIATDEILKVRGMRKRRLDGWVTQADDAHRITVTFVDAATRRKPALARYRVVVSDDGWPLGKAEVLDPPRPLSPFEAGAWRARTLAATAPFAPCSRQYNTVVLPREDGSWTVYLLPGTTDAAVLKLGGAYRYDTDADGQRIAAKRSYTHTCVDLRNDPDSVGLMVTHLLDPTPTEVHVHLSLVAGKPVYVSTLPGGTLWQIENGSIRRVGTGGAGP